MNNFRRDTPKITTLYAGWAKKIQSTGDLSIYIDSNPNL
jgi:hypothetical protein